MESAANMRVGRDATQQKSLGNSATDGIKDESITKSGFGSHSCNNKGGSQREVLFY